MLMKFTCQMQSLFNTFTPSFHDAHVAQLESEQKMLVQWPSTSDTTDILACILIEQIYHLDLQENHS